MTSIDRLSTSCSFTCTLLRLSPLRLDPARAAPSRPASRLSEPFKLRLPGGNLPVDEEVLEDFRKARHRAPATATKPASCSFFPRLHSTPFLQSEPRLALVNRFKLSFLPPSLATPFSTPHPHRHATRGFTNPHPPLNSHVRRCSLPRPVLGDEPRRRTRRLAVRCFSALLKTSSYFPLFSDSRGGRL